MKRNLIVLGLFLVLISMLVLVVFVAPHRGRAGSAAPSTNSMALQPDMKMTVSSKDSLWTASATLPTGTNVSGARSPNK